MRRKFLLKVMILSLLLVAMGGGDLFAQSVTTVTSEDELAAALAAGGNVALGASFKVDNTIEIKLGKTVTLDLNGYEISTEKEIYLIDNNGDLTINDGSENKSGGLVVGLGIRNGYEKPARSIAAKLTIYGGTFKNIYPDNGAAVYNQGQLYIYGGNFYGQNVAISNDNALAYIYGGYIDGYKYAITNTLLLEITDAQISGVIKTTGSSASTTISDAVTFYQARIGKAANYTSYRTLAEAVQAAESGDVVQIIKEGSYDLLEFREKTLTFEGVTLDKTKTSIKDYVNKGSQGMTGSTVNFKNLTINGANENYYGLFHTAGVTYENCDIYGLRFLYSPTTFTNCAFNAAGVEHSFWTYGASNVTVTGCTFTYTDRAVNCYSENGANHELDITFSDCDFVYAGSSDEPAGAVEINSSSVKSMDVAFTNDCTAPEKGEMWYISSYDTDGGDNTIVKVNGETVFEVLPVAKIGDVDYKKLQKAVDAAQDGDVITLVRDCAENVTITQKADVKFTIDGAQKTMTGAITVDGQSGQIETAGLTIQNVKFDASNITTEASINLGVSGNTGSCYVSNLTVEGCTFTGKDQAKVAVKSYTGGDKNLTVTNCTVDATMHSLLQVNNVKGKLTLTGCTVQSKNGINLNSCTNVEMTGCNFDVKGYALRSGVNTGGNLGEEKQFVLNNNILKSACDDGDAVIMFRASSVDANFSMTTNVVEGTTHISGNTAATNIAADANYWGEGLTGPVVAEGSAPVVVNSYYTDEALENLVRNEIGSIYAFVSSDRIFGDVTTNAIESIKIEIIGKDGHVIGSSTLEKTELATGFNKQLTWRINLGADDSDSWAMTWNEGCPSINNMPAKVKLYVDAKEGDAAVAEAEIKYTANGDGQSPVFAAKTNAEGKINSFIACTGEYNLNNAANKLVSASADGDNIAILTAGTYNVPTGKDLTITGAVDGVVFDNIGAKNMGGANVTFNHVTFDYYPNVNYTGLQHSGNLVYNNCTFEGQPFLYGTSETFNNCTFNQNSSDAYNVWTYGAKEVAFNECIFNSAGKSVFVYNEGACATDLTVTDTKFFASATVDDKAAIEIDCSLMPKGTSIVIDGVEEGKTTATGFGENTKSGSSLWNDKKVVEGAPNGGTSSKVIIDDVVVKEPALMDLAGGGTEENPYLISTLEDLIWFRYQVNAGVNYYEGKYVALGDNIDLIGENWVGIGTATADHGFMGNFDGNGYKIKNLTITNPALDSYGYAYAGLFGVTEGTETAQNTIKNLTIENVTISTTGSIVAAAIAYPYYTIVEDVTVCGNIAITGGDYTSGALAYTRRCVNASNLSIVGNDGSFVKGNQTVGGVISDIQMNGGLTAVYKNFSAEGLTISGTKQVGGISGIIATQTLVGASVKNVALECSDARVGIVAGCLGGTSTISNATYDNVTGATAVVGATYDGGKAVEARIGDTYYATLQTAINAAQDGTTTINILADITGDVAILQQEGKNIVIDGKKNDTEKYTFNGTINIYGDARISGEETLTIQNINFYTEDNARYFIHAYDNGQIEGTNNHKQYAHNVTVENCNFATSAVKKPNTIVGMRFRQANDMSAVNCTSDGIYSIMWTTAVDGLTLNNVVATNCTEGITIGGASKKVNITGTTIKSETYAIRADGAGSDFTIEDSTLEAKVPVVVRKVNEDSKPSFTFKGTNTITESNPTSYWFVAGETEYMGTSDEMPETAGQVSVTLNDTGLRYEDVYGNYYELAGEGTADNPYTIANLYELKFFRDAVNAGNTYQGKYVKLTGNIDLAEGQTRGAEESNWTPIGNSTNKFQGTFDGQNHTISNLKIYDVELEYAGFFGYTSATIKNVKVHNVDINAYSHVGAIAGIVYTGNVDNCHVSGTINLVSQYAYAAGITGYGYVTVKNSSVIAEDTGIIKVVEKTGAGGITGWRGEGNTGIYNCTVKNLDITAWSNVGGITGFLHYENTIDNCVVDNVNLYKTREDGQASIGLAAGGWAEKANNAPYTITVKNTTFNNMSINGTAINSFKQNGERLIGSNYSSYINIPAENLVVEENEFGETITDNLSIVVKSETHLGYALASDENEVVNIGDNIVLEEVDKYGVLVGLKIEGNRIIDLNGFTISGKDNSTSSFGLINIQPNAELTINDSSDPSTGKITLTATNNREWNAYSSVISNQRGKLTVNGGTIEHLGGTDMAYGIDNLTNGKGTYAETIITGGTVKSTYRAIRQFLNGTEAQNILTVNGGTIEGANKSIWMQDPSKNANTGTLTVGENAQLKGDVYLYVTDGSTSWPVTVSIVASALQGGSTVMTANVPAGYELKLEDGVYGVKHGVAKTGGVLYESLAEAATAAQNGETIELLWQEGQAPIAMNASLYGKNVTITGKANVDWSKGWFFVGRGGEGNATVTFNGANLTSASDDENSGLGIHVSGREKDTDNKYDGTLVIKNSTIELDYLIDRGTITLDEGAKLTVKNGFGIAGRPASETVSGENATATISLVNGAELIVENHNGMGVGQAANVLEGYGIMNIDAASTFETTQNFNISANGTMNNAGTVTINGTLTNDGTINFTGLDAKLTAQEGLTIVDKVNNPDYAIAYLDGTYQYAEYVAQIGEAKYLTLQEAIDAAQNDETITLLVDVNVTTPAYGQNALNHACAINFTLDLNGKTLSANTGNSVFRFNIFGSGATDDVTVTIKNGKVVSGEDTWCTLMSSGISADVRAVMNLEDLVIENYKGGDFAVKAWANGVVNAEGVTINSTYGGGFYALGGEITLDNCTVNQEGLWTAPYNSMAVGVSDGGKMTVNSGTYSAVPKEVADGSNQGTSHGSWTGGVMSSGGTLIIKGGTFSNGNIGGTATHPRELFIVGADADYGDNVNGQVIINGGTFTSIGDFIHCETIWGSETDPANDYMPTMGVTITAGDFTAVAGKTIGGCDPVSTGNPVDVEISGGTYGANHAIDNSYLVVGYIVVDNGNGTYSVVEDQVAKIGDVTYKLLQEAVDAVAEGETIVLIDNIEQADGVTITDKKNIIIDLNGKTFTVTEGASTNNRNFKINGTSVVTIKNGTMVADGDNSSGAYGTVRTEGAANVTLTGLKLYNYRGNGLNIKALGGTTVDIENTEIYSHYGGGIEAAGGTITLAETVKVEQKGMYTAPYNSMAISVNGGGLVEVNGGTYSTECITAEEANNQGTSHGPWVVGVLNSGGTLIINGGTFSNDNYGDNSLATAARGAVLADTKANVQINGGTFNALAKIFDIQNSLGDAANNPTGVITGGVYSADPTNGYVLIHEDYKVEQLANGYYTVIQVAGTQTCEFANPGWYWFSTYIQFENEEVALDKLQAALDGNASMIKGQHGFTNYSTYNGTGYWSSVASALTTLSTAEMYMIRTTAQSEVELTGSFVDYQNRDITLREGWNWIGYPVSQEMSLSDAIPAGALKDGDQIKSQFDGSATYYNRTLSNGTPLVGWSGQLTQLKPGYGYMFNSASERTFNYTTDGNGAKSTLNTIDYNGENHWFADATQYPNNMTVTAMLSIDGEIVKDNYEVAAFANGECRGSARPIYIEALDAYMLFMTIQGEDVENLTFKYYDVNYGTEYELNNTMVYSNDAIVGTIEEPYMFNLGILNIDETSVDQISIYPNPTTTGKEINLQAMCDKVEVFNALGVKVAEYTNVDSIDAIETAGIYVIRVTIDGNARNCRLIVR